MERRILCVERQVLYRELLGYTLRQLEEDTIVFHAGTAEEALGSASFYQGLDLILLSRWLGGIDGIEILPRLRETAVDVPIVVISSSVSGQDVHQALQAGAATYVTTMIGMEELLQALRRVLAGEPYLPPSLLAGRMTGETESGARIPAKLDILTKRQRDVLHLLSRGLSNKRIANQIDLSEATVKIHVSAILRALGARNRTEAAMMAEDLGRSHP